jgi:hypothetical protein
VALTDNLLSWYRFDESITGSNAADATGNGHTLFPQGSPFPSFVAGKIGNAVDIAPLPGQHFIAVGTGTGGTTWAQQGGDFTVSAFINADAAHLAEGAFIAAQLHSESEGDWGLGWGNQQIWFYERKAGAAWLVRGSSSGGISLSAWHHIVGRRSGSTVTVWIDGASVSLGSSTGGVTGWGANDFVVGGYAGDPNYVFDGKVDLLGVWSRALSDAEIGELYNSGAGFDYPFTGGGAALTKSVSDTLTLGDTLAKALVISRSIADSLTVGESVGSVLTPSLAYFGSVSVPADSVSAVNATTTITLTPPGSMLTGDLVVVCCVSGASNTWSIGVNGGQTWTTEAAYQGSAGPWCRIFWCQFNGTWSTNPRFDSTVGTNTSAIMHVFRPPRTSDAWAIDVALATTQYTAPTTPFTVSRAGLTTAHDNALVLACWHSFDDNTWGSLAGAGWAVTGSAQYRNTSGTPDNSSSFAHYIAATSTAVPTVSKNQLTLGGDAGVTAIIAFYASAGVLTKNLSDAVVMNDLRSGVGTFARSLPDPMTLAEVMARVAQLQRYSMDALTMGETISAVKALLRAFVDPMTVGENLAAVKALIRTYADAITMGELVDRQLTMAAYSDNFNRANSSTVGASWNENITGVQIVSNQVQFTFTGGYTSIVWTQPVAVSAQYAKVSIDWAPGQPIIAGFLFRCSNTSNGTGYRLVWDSTADIIYWQQVSNMTTTGGGTDIASAAFSINVGETIGATLELTGNNTIVRVWKNPTGLPSRANNWNGDTTPDVTFTQNPATPRDAGTFIGLIGFAGTSSADLLLDDWFGGGCLESTGILFSRDLFDGLVLGEASAMIAALFREQADSLVLSEVLGRVAALQRYSADSLTMAENVVKTRTLARGYIETLTMGEALSKRAGKVFANAITLGEAFAKQLQVARSLADPLSMNESVAKAAQFSRARADAIALGENLTIPLQSSKLLADAMTLGEALARVFALRRSMADAVTIAEALSRRINRSVADALSLSEAIATAAGRARSMADPVTLGEFVGRLKQISKSLADSLALNEAIQKIFVGVKGVADPISTLGEALSKQLRRTIANAILMGEGLDKALAMARARVDPLTLNEALSRAMQFRRSAADTLALGEALQKSFVVVRSFADGITITEGQGQSSLVAGLISYWRLDESSGARNDSHGTNHLTDNNSVLSATGKISAAADFEADNAEYLSHADNADLRCGDTDWTLAAWVKVETEVSFRVVASKGWGGGQAEFIIYLFGGLFTLEVKQQNAVANSTAVSPGNWYHVVGWHDSVNNLLGLSVNNFTVTTAWAGGVDAATADFVIGASPGQSLYWDGLIDEVGWWRKVLTPAERTALYNGGAGLDYPFGAGGVAISMGYARARADGMTLAEALVKSIGVAKTLADSMTMAEAFAKSATFRRSISDLMTLADAGTRTVLRQLLSDGLTIGEFILVGKIFNRVGADPIVISDLVTKLIVLVRAFANAISLTESVSKTAAFHRLRADAIALSEAFARSASYRRSPADILSLAEVFGKIATYHRAGADFLALEEALQAARLLFQTRSDAITLSDVVNTQTVIGGLATDRGQHRLIHGRTFSRVN